MFEFKVGYEEMTAALRNVAIGGSVNYCIMLNPNKKDDAGNCEVLISASEVGEGTVNAQALISLKAKLLKMDGMAKFITGAEFAKAVFTIAKLEKEITISFEEDKVRVSCEGSETYVGVKDDFKNLSLNDAEKMVGVVIKTENLKRAVSKGAMYSPESDTIVAKGTVQCKICRNDGELVMRMISTNFERGAFCEVELVSGGYITKKMDENGNAAVEELVSENFAIKSPIMDFVVKNLSAELTQILFGESVATISCGDVSYTIALVAKNYPAELEKLFLNRSEAIKITVDKKQFATAVDLAALTNPEKTPLCVSVGDGFVEVKDFYGKTHTCVEASIEGSYDGDIGLSYKNFKTVLNNLVVEDVFSFSTDVKKPIYFYDSTPRSVAINVAIDLEAAYRAAGAKSEES